MDKFYIAIPTPNLTTNGLSLMRAIYTALFLGREPSVTFSDSSTICTARTSCVETIKKISGHEVERVLWLDSDIMIMNEPSELKQVIEEADKNKYNISGFYNLRDKRGSITGLDKQNIDKEKFNSLNQYDKLLFSGLGFYYGDTPLNYQFKESFNRGEDYNFFIDNNIELRIDKRLVLGHVKSIII
jgi:hypothetical protein